MPLTVVFLWHNTFLVPALSIVRFHHISTNEHLIDPAVKV